MIFRYDLNLLIQLEVIQYNHFAWQSVMIKDKKDSVKLFNRPKGFLEQE